VPGFLGPEKTVTAGTILSGTHELRKIKTEKPDSLSSAWLYFKTKAAGTITKSYL
jgi:hypothetical protein